MMRGDEDDDWEEPNPADDFDDDAELVACPSCGKGIFEDAEQCPYCGDYVVHSTSPFTGRPLWFCMLGVLGVVATVLYLLR